MTPDQFAAKHPPRSPRIPPQRADVERLLTEVDGVLKMPCADQLVASRYPGDHDHSYLWVITPHEVPVVRETAPGVQPPPLELGIAKHTNLTGGGDACCGGEVWLDEVDPKLLYVHGSSGRYPVQSAEQLRDVSAVFEGFGYRVESAGWDEEVNCPSRTFRK